MNKFNQLVNWHTRLNIIQRIGLWGSICSIVSVLALVFSQVLNSENQTSSKANGDVYITNTEGKYNFIQQKTGGDTVQNPEINEQKINSDRSLNIKIDEVGGTLNITVPNKDNAPVKSSLESISSISKKPCCDLSGNYTYQGRGVAKVTQEGNDVYILGTWTPRGEGPHYEIKAELMGNTLKGKWTYLSGNVGWYKFIGEVSQSGKFIDCCKSDDPINHGIKKSVFVKD